MKPFITVFSSATALVLTANSAWAYNFGFVRAPDWMDPYMLFLLIIQVPFWIALAITKPKSISFSTIFQRQSELSRTALYYYRICQILGGVFLVLAFVGMGLARM